MGLAQKNLLPLKIRYRFRSTLLISLIFYQHFASARPLNENRVLPLFAETYSKFRTSRAQERN